ncbi:hypothetical protein [Paracraurococcus ruber]|uniref:hypothetical protein n=1 Tax=Paracraurococcus ruber TaxID=77675 RepID=UPI0010579115|nr:hypothetical protein [Paracraurococcus ruber]
MDQYHRHWLVAVVDAFRHRQRGGDALCLNLAGDLLQRGVRESRHRPSQACGPIAAITAYHFFGSPPKGDVERPMLTHQPGGLSLDWPDGRT